MEELAAAFIGFGAVTVYGYVKQWLVVSAEFQLAAMYVKLNMDSLPEEVSKKLYGLFKQSLFGDFSGGVSDDLSAKHAAWHSLRRMSKLEARKMYISLLEMECPEWRDKLEAMDDPGSVAAWASGSMPLQSIGEGLVSTDPSLGGRMGQLAAESTIVELTELLRTHSVDTVDRDGMSCLHWAADRGNVAIVLMLLSKNPDVNIQDHEGNTPLHYACFSENDEVIKILLDGGADTWIENNDGESVRDLLPAKFRESSPS